MRNCNKTVSVFVVVVVVAAVFLNEWQYSNEVKILVHLEHRNGDEQQRQKNEQKTRDTASKTASAIRANSQFILNFNLNYFRCDLCVCISAFLYAWNDRRRSPFVRYLVSVLSLCRFQFRCDFHCSMCLPHLELSREISSSIDINS